MELYQKHTLKIKYFDPQSIFRHSICQLLHTIIKISIFRFCLYLCKNKILKFLKSNYNKKYDTSFKNGFLLRILRLQLTYIIVRFKMFDKRYNFE